MGTRSFLQSVKDTQVIVATSDKKGLFKRSKPYSEMSLSTRKMSNDSACQCCSYRKQQVKCHYTMEEFWSCCSVPSLRKKSIDMTEVFLAPLSSVLSSDESQEQL